MDLSQYNPIEPVFQYLANESGFRVDQIRYIVLLLMSYPLALVLRFLLHPDHTPLYIRHSYSMLMGGAIGLTCFGWQQMGILLFIVLVSYVLLILVPPSHTQWCSMIWAMSAMSVTHIYRMITDYGGYHLDFSGPLMVMVQKMTLVAFALHDGKARLDSSLSADQREQKISAPPSLFHYLSYNFNFHSFLAGPVCTYREYCAFVDGSSMRAVLEAGSTTTGQRPAKEPSALYPVVSKLVLAVTFMATAVFIGNYADCDTILDPNRRQPYRYFHNWSNTFRLRCRYYFIWLLAESVNNCAGLGFSGYDKLGGAKWDLVSNVHIWEIDFAPNLRSLAQGWNVNTALWLRRCVYERVSFYPTMMTFAVSTVWHGFYPGYYFCFVHFALAVEAARKMRRLVRPYFQGSAALRLFYNIFTWWLTQVYMDFGAVPVYLVWPSTCLYYWSQYYYLPIIGSLVVVFLFPSGKSRKPKATTSPPGEQAVTTGASDGNKLQENTTTAKEIKTE